MESIDFYRHLLQNDPNPLLFLNKELKPQFINNRAKEIFLIGSQDQDSQLITSIRKQWKPGNKEMVVNLFYPSGEKTFRVHIADIFEDNNKVGFLLGFNDLTDHIKDQQRLVESQRNYGNIFLNSFLRMIVIDPISFNVIDINNIALDFYGYNRTEMIGKNFISLFPNNSKSIEAEIQQARINKKGRFFSSQFLANGSTIDVELLVGPLSFFENSNLYVVVNPMIENQSDTWDNQRDMNIKFENLINNINEPILIQNVSRDPGNERFILVNDKAASFLGYAKSELLSMNPLQLVETDSEKVNLDNMLRKILEKKKLQFEITLLDKNLHKIRVEFSSCLNESMLQKQIVSVVRDITNQKKIDEAKNEFINTITHELRTPIAALKASIYLVKEKGREDLNEIIEIADRNIERLLSLVNDILDYQKLTMDRLSFHLIQQQINDLVKQLGNEIKAQLEQKKLQLTLDLDPSLEPIFFDRNRLSQVIMNLLQNAIKFTNQGTVSIITKQDQENVIISIKDTGIGIKNEDIQKLFLPFAQLTDGVDKKGSSGLGLAISKKIINSLGGTIWVESEYGKGSIFSIKIPKKSFFKTYT